VENEENKYPVLDLNRMMINMTNELNDIHKKKTLKEEIMNELKEILMKKLQETVQQNIQYELTEYQDITNKILRRHRNNT
jgi:hypothetical protein